jgi:hypothetical protein
MPTPWRPQGPQGPQGAPGAAGAAGPQGAQGVSNTVLFVWAATIAQAVTTIRYLKICGNTTPSNIESTSELRVQRDGTLTTLRIHHAVANADSFIYTVRVNGVDTALTVTMAGGAVTNTATAAIAVNNGDIVSVKTVQSSTTAGASMEPRATVGWS